MRTVDSSTGGIDDDESLIGEGEADNATATVASPAPVDSHSCDVVEIDRCGSGHVGLVYRGRDKRKPQVWFADRSGTYHYIAGSFTEYLKLMASHLGIPGWQYVLILWKPRSPFPWSITIWFNQNYCRH